MPVPSRSILAAVASAAAAFTLSAQAPAPRGAARDFLYGGGPEQIRYSRLVQINRSNVKQLQVAWTYDTGEPGWTQTQPVVADGVLYGYTTSHKTFAIKADTGAPIWTFDPGLRGTGANRGVMYWASGGDKRVFAAVDNFIYALDAATGTPIPAFGSAGRIDLREHLDRDPAAQTVRLTTPGTIYRDLMIVGGRVGEGLPTSPGDVRAYDVRTGALKWSFHTIPHPGEFGHETWPEDGWTYGGGANSWPGIAVDAVRGLVFVPTGSAASDFYGADRIGDNLFANSLIALDAETGKRRWHFQFVHHDMWDRDLPSPPSLVTVRRNGQSIDAVAQATKHGYVYVFNRTTGEPLFPIEERPFPASGVPGEVAAGHQPLPLLPKPFARQRLTEDMLTTRTPEAHAWALEQFRAFKSDGQFAPFEIDRQTVVFPGYDGGAEYGGQAFDPDTGLWYVNANDIAWTGGVTPSTGGQSGRALYQQYCASCHGEDRAGTPPTIPSLVDAGTRKTFADLVTAVRQGGGRMAGFPALDPTAINAIVQFVIAGSDPPPPAGRGQAAGAAGGGRRGAAPPVAPQINNSFRFTGYRKFLDPEQYPAVAPPWGTLSAINLNTGDYAWQVPLGEYPALAAKGIATTGTENYGGPVVTAGGLIFIAATNHDRKIRAFDKATGALLWEATMPSSSNATPAVYEVNGRQFIAVSAGGGKSPTGGPGGIYIAFALPR